MDKGLVELNSLQDRVKVPINSAIFMIRHIVEVFDLKNKGLQRAIQGDIKTDAEVVSVVKIFNSIPMRNLVLPTESILLEKILESTYIQCVDAKKLNNYTPFGNNVYGETDYKFLSKLLSEHELGENDTFLDLGCGIGSLVLQVAGTTKCGLSVGIENDEYRVSCMERMSTYFQQLAKYHNISIAKYVLEGGDFTDKKFEKYFQTATFIFANNIMFDPTLNNILKEKFKSLPDGTVIISTNAFCRLNVRAVSERNIHDFESLASVTVCHGTVSWTSSSVKFYRHVIDRTRRNDFLAKRKSERNIASVPNSIETNIQIDILEEFECKHCERKMKTKSLLSMHNKMLGTEHTKDDLLSLLQVPVKHIFHECILCSPPKQFKERRRDLVRHIVTNHRDVPSTAPFNAKFSCAFCGYGTNSKDTLEKHIEREHFELLGKLCTEKLMSERNKQNISEKKVQANGSLFCHVCKKYCTFHMLDLLRHITSLHTKSTAPKNDEGKPVGGRPTTFNCLYCDKKAHTVDPLRKHIRAFHIDDIRSLCMKN